MNEPTAIHIGALPVGTHFRSDTLHETAEYIVVRRRPPETVSVRRFADPAWLTQIVNFNVRVWPLSDFARTAPVEAPKEGTGDVVTLWFNTASYAGGMEIEPEPEWMSEMEPGERVQVRIVRMPTTQQQEERPCDHDSAG